MSNGRYEKKKTRSFPVWLLVIILVSVVALIVFLVKGYDMEDTPSDPLNTTAEAFGDTEMSGSGSVSETESPQNPETESAQKSETENTQKSETESTEKSETPKETEKVKETGSNGTGTAQNREPENTEGTDAPTETPETPATQPSVEIQQQADAEYEKWLAAAMFVCVSMEYPDFELDGIYAASATALADKYDSDGAYIIFSSGGSRLALHSIALEKERSESGTMDISTEVMGYATFDLVDPASVSTEDLIAIDLDELSELIAQSMLVSIYTH